MPNTNLPTTIIPDVTDTIDVDMMAAWAEVNRLSQYSGIRDVTSLLANGWAAGTVRVRRIVNNVYWEFFNLNGSAATSTTMLDLTAMTGFAPSASNESGLLRDKTGSAPGYFRASTTGLTCPTGFVAPASTVHVFYYRCSAAWPTALPGTAVAG